MDTCNPTFGAREGKYHRLHFPSAHGDWSGHGLILTRSRAHYPMTGVVWDAGHMQLTRHFPTHPALEARCASHSTCVERGRGLCLLVDRDCLDAGPRIRIVPGAVRSTVSRYDDLLLYLWYMSCTQ
jgi:hypothetical protein